MICANPDCTNEIINRRSDAHSCSIQCSLKVKWLREKVKHKDKRKLYRKEYHLKNPHIQNALNAKRYALKVNATPKFANLKKIKEIYKNCPKGYHVDHIVPLISKVVCGLHVEWNLQYLTASDNHKKSNKLII